VSGTNNSVSGARTSVSGKRGNGTNGVRIGWALPVLGLSWRMRDHKSLHAWQEARGVVLGTIELARTAWKPYAAALFSQLQRASLSVQLNIAEGYAYGASRTYTRHLNIAYGSAVETGELLEIALDANIVASGTAKHLLQRNRRSQRLLLGMLRRLGR
jgi:four helix bundle protein